MKSSETTLLVVAGHLGLTPDHWQSRLIGKLSTAKLVEPDYGSLKNAVATLRDDIAASQKPVVIIAHSVGCCLVAHAAEALESGRVKGAFLVAPPHEKSLRDFHGIDPRFVHVPRNPLPFPSLLVASSNDAFSSLEDSADLASAWGSQLVEAGAAGHLDAASGYGPWPEGLMRFAGFLNKLQA